MRPRPRLEAFLAGVWLAVIGLCLFYGRRAEPFFSGTSGLWAAGFLLAGAALAGGLVYGWWHKLPAESRPGAAWRLLAVALGLALLAWAQPLLVERTHLVLYGILGWLFYGAATGSANGRWPLVLALVGVAAVGVADELVQAWHPERVGDLRDAATNAVSGALGVWARAELTWPLMKRI